MLWLLRDKKLDALNQPIRRGLRAPHYIRLDLAATIPNDWGRRFRRGDYDVWAIQFWHATHKLS